MWYQQMDVIFQKIVLASSVGERLMNTISRHFIVNFVQKKVFREMIFHLSKIFKRKDKAIFLFLFFPSSFFLFSIFNLKMKTNMLKFICTSAKCKKN